MNMELARTHIRDIVVEDYRTAAVFQKYGLDFCCGGAVPVEQACREKNIDTDGVVDEVEAVLTAGPSAEPNANEWELDFLAEYIVQNHHRFVTRQTPVLRQHAEKVASVHGERRPELVEVAGLVDAMLDDMASHMLREEQVLFPLIKALARAQKSGESIEDIPMQTVRGAIQVMEAEHSESGNILERLRELTDDYNPPSSACMTYRVLFKELEEFDLDMRRHIHLENNILFPKSIRLESRIKENPDTAAVRNTMASGNGAASCTL